MRRFLFVVFSLAMLPLSAMAQTNTFPSSGPVGIGTTTPTAGSSLDVVTNNLDTYYRSPSSTGYSRIFVNNDVGGGFYMVTYGSGWAGGSGYTGIPQANLTFLLGTAANGLVVGTSGHYPIVFSVFGADNMRIDPSGNIGIGQSSPTSKLDVNGTFHVSGNAAVDGNIAAKYQDVAEWVETTSASIKPGTVVVLDRNNANTVIPSARAYDTAVAGVVSEKPGLILGEQSASKVQVATTGRVKVRVDATKNPIMIGDLLVSGSTPGTAIKSQPVSVGGIQMHRPGTVIGKALESLPSGEGEILVLLSLQ